MVTYVTNWMVTRLPTCTKTRQDKRFWDLVLYCLVSTSWKNACRLSDKTWQEKIWPRIEIIDKPLSTAWQALVSTLTRACHRPDKCLSEIFGKNLYFFSPLKASRPKNFSNWHFFMSHIRNENLENLIRPSSAECWPVLVPLTDSKNLGSWKKCPKNHDKCL